MSEKSQIAKLEFILEMIENIETIIHRHGGIVNLRMHLPKLKEKISLAKKFLQVS